MKGTVESRYRIIPLSSGVIIFLQGILLFAGVIFNIPFFTSLVSGGIEMNSVTGILFLFCGTSLLLNSFKSKSTSPGYFIYPSAILIIIVSLATLSGHILDYDLSADFLLPSGLQSKSTMAPNTAFVFILTGISLLLLKKEKTWIIYLSQTLIIFSLLISLTAFLGYLYSIASFYSVSSKLPMAFNTSIMFLLLCSGLLFSNPGKGLMAVVTDDKPGGFIARRIIPLIFVVPVLLGWARILGEQAGLYDSSTGVAIFVVAVIISYFLLILYSSFKLNIMEIRSKEAERKTKESEIILRSIIDNSPSAIYLKDLSKRFIMVNKATERNHNMKESEIAGKTLSDLFPGYPDMVKQYEDNDMAVITSGKFMEFEEQAMLADGIHTYISHKFPLFDVDNKVYAMCGISTDITYRKNDSDKFIAILESAPDAMIIVDKQGRILIVNKQTEIMFGYKRDELIGNSIEVLVPEELRRRHISHREGFNNDHSARPMGSGLDLNAVRRDGSLFPVEISLSPMQTSEGTLISAAIRDITERKKADVKLKELNRQLEESNKELESFSYSVSHDLRSPLRHVIGFGEKFRSRTGNKLDSEDQRLLEKILGSSVKMGKLIDDLLMFSRVGRTQVMKSELDMQKLFTEVINEQDEYYGEGAIKWKLGELMSTRADQFQMKIVASNLISNAVKYTGKKERREIEIGCRKNGSECTYFVKDNGTGFDMKYSDKLFGVFQRLHTDSEFEGTGIGLATVGRIIKKHGGKVWAEAEPGKGATFYFTIPD